MNSFLLVCDVFSFVFWKKLKTPKRHFEIIWPLGVGHWAPQTVLIFEKKNLMKKYVYEVQFANAGSLWDMSIFKDSQPFHNQFGVFCLYLKRFLIKATFLECYRMFCYDDCKLFPLYKYMGKPRFICMQCIQSVI